MIEETYRVRHFNEIKIDNELHTIEQLRKGLNQSQEQTNKMTNLLDNFELRLTKLHDLIMPVYDATNMLQIKNHNIKKAVVQLDSIIEYYDSVKNLSMIVKAGPGKDINNYISHLNKLKSAIEYFAVNKNQSQKKQNEELWMEGKLNVEREFEQLLSKFSESFLANEKKADKVDGRTIQFRENDLKQIVSIIEWFKQSEASHLDKLYEKIIRSRNSLILDALKQLKDKKSSSLGQNYNASAVSLLNAQSNLPKRSSLIPLSPSSGNLYGQNAPGSEDKRKTLGSRLTENLFSSANDKNKRMNRTGQVDVMNASKTPAQGFEEDFETTECAKFIEMVQKTEKMFTIENNLLNRILEDDRVVARKILERIYDPVLRFLHNEAEVLASNVAKISKKCTSKYVIAMFNMLSELVESKARFLKLFEQSSSLTKTTRHIGNSIQLYLDVFVAIEKACSQSLRDVIEEIKQDPQTLQPNGNIHQITTETITFIKNLLPFDIIAGFIAPTAGQNQAQLVPSEVEINLRKEASNVNASSFTQIAYQVSSDKEKLSYRISLAEYFSKLFKWLNMNLKNKAENYQDENLKWIFLLNNAYKIAKVLNESNNLFGSPGDAGGKCRNLMELFSLTGKRDLKQFYDSEILNYKKEYSKCWSRLISYIKDLNETYPFSQSKLRDKERQLLKDRFAGFNKEFEEIYERQKRYYIPAEQSELAQILRQDNDIYIVTQYKKFYDAYSNLDFATNKEKYVRYSPELLSARLREFFTGD